MKGKWLAWLVCHRAAIIWQIYWIKKSSVDDSVKILTSTAMHLNGLLKFFSQSMRGSNDCEHINSVRQNPLDEFLWINEPHANKWKTPMDSVHLFHSYRRNGPEQLSQPLKPFFSWEAVSPWINSVLQIITGLIWN